jgi:ABC-2 type transport system ATP-binding protein
MTPSSNSSISVKNLVKIFNHSFKAVNDVSFDVSAGSIFAFLGPNGAGKTTTIKMLTTLMPPTSGTVMINGFDPMKDSNSVRKSFGIVFQDPSLDDELTAYENMFFHAGLYGVPRNETPGRIKELLNFVELWDRKDSLVKTFSGGMKRRLEIARGLLHTPAILFLDEPTIGLDPQTRNHIWEYIKKLNSDRGLTVFFTTHYMEEAERVADHVAIIDYGKIVANGTAQEIVAKANAVSLEDAFIKLTGHEVREEEAGAIDRLRSARRMWRRH